MAVEEAYGGLHVSRLNSLDTVEFNVTLEESLYKKLNGLPPSFSYERCCIYRVPNKLRRVKEEAYSPRLVSIGPLHHGSPHLQAMEVYKVRCLKTYLQRNSYNVVETSDLKIIAAWAENMESYVRMCYQETIKLSIKELSEMLLLDGVFIVELFLNNYFPELREERDEIDLLLGTKWMMCDLFHDMMLLENQLPFRVPLELLYIIGASIPTGLEFIDLSHKFFKYVGNTNNVAPFDRGTPKHLLDYMLCVHLNRDKSTRDDQYINTHRRGIMLEYPYSATVLQEAGVKFSTETKSCLLDIAFECGVLTIPKIMVNEWTETFFRNLIAYEQCDHKSGYVTSYVIFMDSIIKTPKDVDILVKYGIIGNSLGDSEQVFDLFNNLYKEVVTEDSCFHFSDISKKLNDYSKDYLHQWRAAWFKWHFILKCDYFSNPWTIISVVAAIILLGLTIVQAVCSVLQLHGG